MYIIYVLKSKLTNHYYIGQTNNITKRLKEHNAGLVASSKRYKPWMLHYSEVAPTKIEALCREKYLKSHAGRNWLKKNLDG